MPLFALFSNIGQRFWSSILAHCFTPRSIFVEDPTPFWYKHVPSALSHVQDYWLLHILGCPAIILNPRLRDGKRLPWVVPSPLAWVALWVILSIVSFILSLQTCALRRDDLFQKDWFSIVSNALSSLQKLHSTGLYIFIKMILAHLKPGLSILVQGSIGG